ncbi:MAG: homoserine dehydrogenase [Chloroflexota bacterium]|nr:homoserine dehydrogenase [Chloroflexota bacterium]
MRTARLAIVGLGNVGRRLLELIELKRALLRERFDLELILAGAVDTSGGAVSVEERGLAAAEILRLKRGKKGIAAYARAGKPGMTPQQLVEAVDADVLVELSLTNLKDGEPGLSTIRAALARQMNVVTANKGPLVLAFQELMALARANGVRVLHSATVTGGLPTLNIGTRDLGATVIDRFEGVLNGTTNYILSRMTEGQSYDEALKRAQDIGMAEADPALDVDGWDAANKLVIIANAVLHRPTTLKDLTVTGVRKVTQDDLREAMEHRQVIKLIAQAEMVGKDYRLSVAPTRLDKTHPLANVGAGMMGVIYHTDINGTIFATIEEDDPYPTAAAVLRDVIQAQS